MMIMNRKEAKEKQRREMRKYYQENKAQYYEYVKKNPEKVKIWHDRYRKSAKGKRAIKRYESKPHRKAAKALWNFKRYLQEKVDAGEISEYEMRKRIKERLENEI